MNPEGGRSTAWSDVGLFVTFAFAGALVLIAGDWASVRGVYVHSLVAVQMLSYSAVAGFAPRFRLRRDQAGDNAYYLGLLFTLVSMSLALSGSSAGQSVVDRLLGAFGVALTSTILGVFLRIVLHQMRLDPIDVEEVARQDLLEASNRLKSWLENSTREFARFPVELHTVARDAVREVLADWSRLVKESVEAAHASLNAEMTALASVASTLQQRHADAEREFSKLVQDIASISSALEASIDRVRAIEAPPTKFATVLEKTTKAVVSATAELEDAQLFLRESVQSFTTVLSSAKDATLEVGRLVEAVREREREVGAMYREAGGKMVESSNAFAAELASATSSVEQLKRLALEAADEHRTLKAAADETVRGLGGAVKSLTTALKALSE